VKAVPALFKRLNVLEYRDHHNYHTCDRITCRTCINTDIDNNIASRLHS